MTPILLREGGMIRKGFNERLTVCATLRPAAGQNAEIEQAERERTISKLKIGYNRVRLLY
ncbi:MAG: hypothetical protein ACLT2F_10720 [Butyricicoccus sp.]